MQIFTWNVNQKQILFFDVKYSRVHVIAINTINSVICWV